MHNPIGRVYTPAEYNRLPIGTIVEFPTRFAIARPVEPVGQSITTICASYFVYDCATRLSRRNFVRNAETPLHSRIWIPMSWEEVRPPSAQPVSAPQPQTSPVWWYISVKQLDRVWQLFLLALAAILLIVAFHKSFRNQKAKPHEAEINAATAAIFARRLGYSVEQPPAEAPPPPKVEVISQEIPLETAQSPPVPLQVKVPIFSPEEVPSAEEERTEIAAAVLDESTQQAPSANDAEPADSIIIECRPPETRPLPVIPGFVIEKNANGVISMHNKRPLSLRSVRRAVSSLRRCIPLFD